MARAIALFVDNIRRGVIGPLTNNKPSGGMRCDKQRVRRSAVCRRGAAGDLNARVRRIGDGMIQDQQYAGDAALCRGIEAASISSHLQTIRPAIEQSLGDASIR